jgi:hypothetical protein
VLILAWWLADHEAKESSEMNRYPVSGRRQEVAFTSIAR